MEKEKMIDKLTPENIKQIRKRLEWTREFKKEPELWLVAQRQIKSEYGITDKEILEIVNKEG